MGHLHPLPFRTLPYTYQPNGRPLLENLASNRERVGEVYNGLAKPLTTSIILIGFNKYIIRARTDDIINPPPSNHPSQRTIQLVSTSRSHVNIIRITKIPSIEGYHPSIKNEHKFHEEPQ